MGARMKSGTKVKSAKEIIKVVVADDHPVFRHGVRSLIEIQPDMCVIGEASDGIELVELVAEELPDVVVMDLRMPRLDGISAAKAIRQNHPNLPVIVLSTYHEEEDVLACAKLGVQGYLLKHSPPQELLDAIRAVRRGESIIDRLVAGDLIKTLAESKAPESTERLTAREAEILRYLSVGLNTRDIAGTLTIAPKTVRSHVSNLFRKLGVSNRTEAVIKAIRLGLVVVDQGVGHRG